MVEQEKLTLAASEGIDVGMGMLKSTLPSVLAVRIRLLRGLSPMLTSVDSHIFRPPRPVVINQSKAITDQYSLPHGVYQK
jgi:hypothetical protein